MFPANSYFFLDLFVEDLPDFCMGALICSILSSALQVEVSLHK